MLFEKELYLYILIFVLVISFGFLLRNGLGNFLGMNINVDWLWSNKGGYWSGRSIKGREKGFDVRWGKIEEDKEIRRIKRNK